MKKQVKELSLERAKALLGDKKIEEIKEDQLEKMLERIKVFCKVAYQLYSKNYNPDKPTEEIHHFKSEPPDEFTKAA